MKILHNLILPGLVVMALACGKEESDTNVVVNPGDDDVQLEEDGGGNGDSPTVIVNNRIDNDVNVSSRTRVVDNNFHMRWTCRRAAPVIHRQYVYVSVRCPTVDKDDYNKDGVLDAFEVEQAAGPKVMTLDSPSGSEYTYEHQMPLSQLHRSVPEGKDFIVMIHGVDQASYSDDRQDHLSIPIACIVVKAPRGHSVEYEDDHDEYPNYPSGDYDDYEEEEDCGYDDQHDDQYDNQYDCPYDDQVVH